MTVIPVDLPEKSYKIAIAHANLDQLGAQLKSLNVGNRVLLVSNPTIFRHYGERAIASLEAAGFTVGHCLLPDGEQYKTPATLQTIYDAALEHRIERSSSFVALGGGIIGDMTGFAAATWLRGINVVQVPTSLLAMVDAAIGGKTGVNHPKGKNLIGAFHQPKLVLIDPQVLKTLPTREFRAGMAEVIKYGVIWDADLFAKLEAASQLDEFAAMSEDLLAEVLIKSCQAKAHVVSQDEKESGLRAILNYGHTIAHAVESLTGYQGVNHGEAVGIGMVAAGEIAVAMGMWSRSECDRQNTLIAKCGLPTQLPQKMDLDEIVTALQSDKKVQSGQVRFILPTAIGSVVITDQVTSDVIKSVLEKM